jgi:hypothetical protein
VICGFLILLVPDIGLSVGGWSVVVSVGVSMDIGIAVTQAACRRAISVPQRPTNSCTSRSTMAEDWP